ncbi:hypothetical protein LTR95_017174 [Oleoguttula sp. CCFEE 5521]
MGSMVQGTVESGQAVDGSTLMPFPLGRHPRRLLQYYYLARKQLIELESNAPPARDEDAPERARQHTTEAQIPGKTP